MRNAKQVNHLKLTFIVGFTYDACNKKAIQKPVTWLNMKISIHFGNFYQVFSVLACLWLNLGVKQLKIKSNADMRVPDKRSVHGENLDQSAACG